MYKLLVGGGKMKKRKHVGILFASIMLLSTIAFIDFSVAQETTSETLILRPESNGYANYCEPFGNSTNWMCVAEAIPNDDVSYVYLPDWIGPSINNDEELYVIKDHTTET